MLPCDDSPVPTLLHSGLIDLRASRLRKAVHRSVNRSAKSQAANNDDNGNDNDNDNNVRTPAAYAGSSDANDGDDDGDTVAVAGIVNASILAADVADLSGEVSRVVEAGADWIHVDVVDNHFAKVCLLGGA